MKILCISDLIDPLVYSPNIKERFSDIDLILCAGDLPLDYLDFIVSCLNKPLYFVFGNHHIDDLPYFKNSEIQAGLPHDEHTRCCCGATHIGSQIKRENDLIIAGLGGCMRYNRGPNQYSDFRMYLEILRLLPAMLFHRIAHGRYVDILLTHAPPKGIHDKNDLCHRGFKAFVWFIKKFKPRYLVHGHIHLYDLSDVRITEMDGTSVVNAYGHYVLQFDRVQQ